MRLARISLSIVFIFLLCHSPKIIPRSLFQLAWLEKPIQTEPPPFFCKIFISNRDYYQLKIVQLPRDTRAVAWDDTRAPPILPPSHHHQLQVHTWQQLVGNFYNLNQNCLMSTTSLLSSYYYCKNHINIIKCLFQRKLPCVLHGQRSSFVLTYPLC